MTKDEFKIFVKGLNSLYGTTEKPVIENQYKFDLWYTMLSDLEYKTACAALKNYGLLNHFQPAVSDIREEYVKLTTIENETTEQEAWAMIRLAIRNGLYCAENEFDALPDNVKRAVGNANSIRMWAQMPSEEVETVIQSQVLRSYRAVLKQKHEESLLGASGTQRGSLIEELTKKLSITEKES